MSERKPRSSSLKTDGDEVGLADRFDKMFSELEDKDQPRSSRNTVDFTEAGFNPFLYYGVGVNNFVKMNSRLVLIFAVLSVFACAQMIIFRSFSGLDSFKTINPVANWSFGGMGYPGYYCRRNYIDWS